MRIEEFIEARLAEDESAARKAADFPYDAPSDAPWVSMQLRVRRGVAMTSDEHFARHDPARALRQVERDRKVLARHHKQGIAEMVMIGGGETCVGCGVQNGPRAWPCAEVRDLAAIWSDHPDYQPEWAV